jgi:hypothetical protein
MMMMMMKLYNTLVLPNLLHGSENWTTKARDEIYENNSRIQQDRSKNKHRHCKGITYKPNFGENTGLQEKVDTT